MNLPNLLTILRLCMVPLFVFVYWEGKPWYAFAVFVLASFTDLLDGFLARKYNQITDWGKVMDPLADKIMLVTVLICLYLDNKAIPFLVLLLVLIKESLMIAGGVFLYKKRDVVVFSKLYGKMSTGLFFAGIVLTFFREQTAPYNLYVLYIALILSLYSMIMYAATNFFRKQSRIGR